MIPLNPERLRERRRAMERCHARLAAKRRMSEEIVHYPYLAVPNCSMTPCEAPPKPSHWWRPLSWMWAPKML